MGRDFDSLVTTTTGRTGVPALEIRSMVAADLDQVLGIEAECFPRPWSRRSFERELSIAHSTILVAEFEGRVVGYLCRWRMDGEIQILNIAVASTARCRGIARGLMESVLAEARRPGESVTLEVAHDNAPALSLYESLGFSRIGERKDFYGRGRPGVMMTWRPDRSAKTPASED